MTNDATRMTNESRMTNDDNPQLQKAFTDHLEEAKGHVERLEQTLEEEGMADKKLSDLAERVINIEAAEG